MALSVKPKDLLRAFVAAPSNPAWAKDMVCLAISTGGCLSDDDKTLIWEELENGTTTQSQVLPPAIGALVPQVAISKLRHVKGVNALANDQEIVFCEKGITLIYGHNRSGKSGYFRILNQLCKGEISYNILQNVYKATPSPIEISVDYKLGGTPQPTFVWDGVSSPPGDLRNVRLFDSQYSTKILKHRDGESYVFECNNLKIFRAIYDTLYYLKNDLHVAVAPAVEQSLDALCTSSYRDTLKQAMVDAFTQEIKKLGMPDLHVSLEFDDLLKDTSKIKIKLSNTMEPTGVLSEAELKCAALAWFFAENDLLNVKQPIIFDDPVNSLDAYIISAFVDRLSELENQVVLFTHNILLQEALSNERQFKVYYNTPHSSGNTTTKRHVWFYDVLTSVDEYGFVLWHEKKKTLFYLDRANSKLAARPVIDPKGIVDDLRMAVEWAIDEVVFLGLATKRFTGASDNQWLKMESMANAGPNNVRELKRLHAQLSSMGSHLGYSSYAITPSPVVLQRISNEIMAVCQTVPLI